MVPVAMTIYSQSAGYSLHLNFAVASHPSAGSAQPK
jgi:hypothetical protein